MSNEEGCDTRCWRVSLFLVHLFLPSVSFKESAHVQGFMGSNLNGPLFSQ